MSRPGRKSKDPYVKWLITMPESIASAAELRLLDPILLKPRYGARAQLVQVLIQKWLAGEIQIPL